MDAQGSVVATTYSAQAQTGDMRYDAFGNKTYYVNTAGTFGWNAKSQYQTDASGLMLLGNRYYDPAIGRFISQDPAQDESNWYSYCGNNPLVAVDPSGLFPQPSGEFNGKAVMDAASAAAAAFLDSVKKEVAGLPAETKDAGVAFAAYLNSMMADGGAFSVGGGATGVSTPWAGWGNANLVIQPGASWWNTSTWNFTLNVNAGLGLGIGRGVLDGINVGVDPHFQTPATVILKPNLTAGAFAANLWGVGGSVTSPPAWPPKLSYTAGRVGVGKGGGVYAGPQLDLSVNLRWLRFLLSPKP